MAKEPVDDKDMALVGLLHVLFGAALGIGALFVDGGDRSLLGALAFVMIAFGTAYEYIGHRGQVWRAVRRRAASRRDHS